MPRTKAGDAGKLLVFLNQGLGFACNIFRGDLNLDFPLGAATGFCGAHVYLSPPASFRSPCPIWTNLKPLAYSHECKDRSRRPSNWNPFFSAPFWDFSNCTQSGARASRSSYFARRIPLKAAAAFHQLLHEIWKVGLTEPRSDRAPRLNCIPNKMPAQTEAPKRRV
jgi:hypothetical protein